jgi:hypothetical protein
MTVDSITNKLNQYLTWLSSRRLEEWWPLLIVIAVLVLVLRSRRKVLPDNDQLREIIGIKLADHDKTDRQTDRKANDNSANVPEKRGGKRKRIGTTKGLKIAIMELKQRHNEIIKSRQAETLVQKETVKSAAVYEQLQHELADSKKFEELPTQKVVEVADVIEQFQNEIAVNNQDDQRPVQKVYEIVPDNEPFQLKITDSKKAGQHPIQKVSEIAAINEQFQQEKLGQAQSEKVTEQNSEQESKSKQQGQPFDIAEFSKAAISKRQGQGFGLYNEDRDIGND